MISNNQRRGIVPKGRHYMSAQAIGLGNVNRQCIEPQRGGANGYGNTRHHLRPPLQGLVGLAMPVPRPMAWADLEPTRCG